jgi:hypothetical protein
MIETYKRKGCMKFYELALLIEQIVELFGMIEDKKPAPEKP